MKHQRAPARGPVLAAWGTALLGGGCELASDNVDLAAGPPSVQERRWVHASWDTVFVVGGSPDDTLLILPTRLAADEAGVSVLDRQAGRVVRFDRDGRFLWSYGRRGRGPEEFDRPRDIKLDGLARTWVLDVGNARLVVIGEKGERVHAIPLAPVGRPADSFVPGRNEDAVILAFDPEWPLVRISFDGRVLERFPFPWVEYRALHPLAAQLVTGNDPGSDRWAAAFALGDGLFRFRETRSLGHRARFVEPVAFPQVGQSRQLSSGRHERSTWLSGATEAAQSISLSGERLLVFFGGGSPDRHRILDVYSITDGSYVESLRLPLVPRSVAYAGGLAYAIYENPYPTLAAWRLVKELKNEH